MKRLLVLIGAVAIGLSSYGLFSVRGVGNDQQRTAIEYYREGHDLYWRGCVSDGYDQEICEEAIERLEKAIEIDSKLADAYLLLATAYWNTGLEQKSDAILRKLIAVDPQNADAYYKLSQFTEDEKERKRLLAKAIELDPKHPEAHGALGLLLLREGEVDDAIREYRTHMEVTPFRTIEVDGNQHMYFALLLQEAGRLEEAVEIYEKVLSLTQGQRRFQRCHLFIALDLKPFAAFDEFIRKVQALRPYCTNLEHRNRAVQLERQGKTEEAVREWELQIKENPHPEEAYFALERIHLSQGQPEKALE
ncbi:MAG: tetratricopeptide repeat protein, partial [Acidobacteria bacterium]|nr:tetratricopeptide repeat protein [Acidobacteriota bacterium]